MYGSVAKPIKLSLNRARGEHQRAPGFEEQARPRDAEQDLASVGQADVAGLGGGVQPVA
jgi:hypothetical protein